MKNPFVYFLLFMGIGLSAQVNADKIIGDWISPEKDLIVRCFKYQDTYYSTVVWFKRYYDNKPDDPYGIPEKKWFGSIVMKNFKYNNNEWIDGEITNLKNGKKYSAYIKLKNDNEIEVVGYVVFRIFSETILFTRYQNKDLPEFN